MRNLAEFPITTDEIVGTIEEVIKYEGSRDVDNQACGNVTVAALEEALARIKSIPNPDLLEGYGGYSVPDWDGHGALPITRRTVDAARQFLNLLRLDRLPDVVPGGDGSVGFEWHLEGGPIATLIVDFGDDGVFAEATDRDSAKVNVNAVYVTNEPLPNEGNVGLAMNVASTALHLADDAQACVSNPNKANVEDMLASMRIMRHRMERAMRELGEEW